MGFECRQTTYVTIPLVGIKVPLLQCVRPWGVTKLWPQYGKVVNTVIAGNIRNKNCNKVKNKIKQTKYDSTLSYGYFRNLLLRSIWVVFLNPVCMKKGYPGKAGHHLSRVNLSELLYEKNVDPFARPIALAHASLKQLLRKLWLSIATADRVDPAGRVKVLIIMEKRWPV